MVLGRWSVQREVVSKRGTFAGLEAAFRDLLHAIYLVLELHWV